MAGNKTWLDAFFSNALERPVFEKFLLLPFLKDWFLKQSEVRAAAMFGFGLDHVCDFLKSGANAPAIEARVKEEFGGTMWTAICDAPI